MIKFTEFELFKDLTFLERANNKTFDLHNEYNCIGITYNSENKTLNIALEPTLLSDSRICLFFESAIITQFELDFSLNNDMTTINAFYRGRFKKDDALFESSAEEQGYFYIEFENGSKLEFFSSGFELREI